MVAHFHRAGFVEGAQGREIEGVSRVFFAPLLIPYASML